MKLTGRQKTFLSRFLDLYRQDQEPIHYTSLAEYLGIGRITAYEMLRLLEEKGLVSSEYVLPEGGRERGRSTVLFRPTQQAEKVIAGVVGDEWNRAEWKAVKRRMLAAVRECHGTDYSDLLDDILLRMPERRTPMLYVAEMITAAVLNLYQVRHEAEAAGLFDYLRRMGRAGELGLGALAGLTMGLSLVERANRRFTSRLLSYTSRYQEAVGKLSSEGRQTLADFAREVMHAAGL